MPATDYSGGETRTVSMFSKLMQQSSSLVMEGVKNLVVKKHNLPVTKIVDELMEIKQGSYNEEYLYFDPKILRGQDNIPRAKNPFQVEWFFSRLLPKRRLYILLSSFFFFFLSTIYNLPIFLFSTKVLILIFSDLVQRSYE